MFSQAVIWKNESKRREIIYAAAAPNHKKMIYLPLYIIKKATNIRDVVINNAKSQNVKITAGLIDGSIISLYEKLYFKNWLPVMEGLDFIAITESDSSEDETPLIELSSARLRNASMASKNTSSRSKDSEPLQSTTRAKTSMQSEIVKITKKTTSGSDMIPKRQSKKSAKASTTESKDTANPSKKNESGTSKRLRSTLNSSNEFEPMPSTSRDKTPPRKIVHRSPQKTISRLTSPPKHHSNNLKPIQVCRTGFFLHENLSISR